MDQIALRWLTGIPDGLLDAQADQLDGLLGGPVVLDLAGADASLAPVFVSVLLHGNETSGWAVMRKLLRDWQGRPPRPLTLLIGNTAAAAAGTRSCAGRPDFNRLWGADDPSGGQFWQLRETLRQRQVATAIDVHNTNGANPPHAIYMARPQDAPAAGLCAAYSGIAIATRFELATCMEAFGDVCPSVTLECGLPGDRRGIELATGFIGEVVAGRTPAAGAAARYYDMVARVCVWDCCKVGFNGAAGGGADIDIVVDPATSNFMPLPAATVFARVNVERAALHAVDWRGVDIAARVFSRRGADLELAGPFTPAMLVDDTGVVDEDCLCYLLAEESPPSTQAA